MRSAKQPKALHDIMKKKKNKREEQQTVEQKDAKEINRAEEESTRIKAHTKELMRKQHAEGRFSPLHTSTTKMASSKTLSGTNIRSTKIHLEMILMSMSLNQLES